MRGQIGNWLSRLFGGKKEHGAADSAVTLAGVANAPKEAAPDATQKAIDAVNLGDVSALRKALQRVDPNFVLWEDGWTLLHEAVGKDVAIMKELLRHRMVVNVSTDLGYTPLMRAGVMGDWASVEVLLQHGADLAACDHEGLMALDFALGARKSEVAELLARELANRVLRDRDNREHRGCVLVPLDVATI